MGWSGGDDVARCVIIAIRRAMIPDQQRMAILAETISALRSADWDTYDDVLWDFLDVPWIVTAFERNGITTSEADQGPESRAHVAQGIKESREEGS